MFASVEPVEHKLSIMRSASLAVAFMSLAGLAAAQDLGMKEHAGLRFACGGAGVEERVALAALRPQANLELLFVTARRGGYLADVEVALYAAGKEAAVLQVTAEGPICMIAAPAGKYRIEASYRGIKRTVHAAANAAQARVVLRFPDEPWDGIKASEEEKQPARTP
jgi:hypothetical protein